MIPCELQLDKDGLLYLKDDNVKKRNFLCLDKRAELTRYDKCLFYSLDSTDDYIIKYYTYYLTSKDINAIKEMLSILVSKQENIKLTDFPIGYLVYLQNLSGLIIKYYKDGVSLDNIFISGNMGKLSEYYHHDDNNLHNVFLLFYDILNLIYELMENSIFYNDINPGNIVITNEQARLIDFDHRYVTFKRTDNQIKRVMTRFHDFVSWTLGQLYLHYQIEDLTDYEQARKTLTMLENKIRRGR